MSRSDKQPCCPTTVVNHAKPDGSALAFYFFSFSLSSVKSGNRAGISSCEVALEVTSKALQSFSTCGYTADFAIEHYFRDARGLMLVAQPPEMRKLILGRVKLGLPPMGPLPSGPPSG